MPTRLLRALVMALALCAAAAPAAAARTDNRTKPVVFIHGMQGDENSVCEDTWRNMISRFRGWGWTNTFAPVKYYVRDESCSTTGNVTSHQSIDHHGSHTSFHGGTGHEGTSHNSDSSIRHLAYHLAWYIYDHYSVNGQAIDVAAHSMGGLMIRYAIAKTRDGAASFPPLLRVEDVITMGTPHLGTSNVFFCQFDTQCQEMHPDSTFMNYLNTSAKNPQAYNGTEWTVMGSGADDMVSPESATGMSTPNRVRYYTDMSVEHSDYMHQIRDITDAHADVWDKFAGQYRENYAWLHAVINADWALYDDSY